MANNNTNTMKIIFEGESKQLEAAIKRVEKALKGFDEKAKKAGGTGGGLPQMNNQLKSLARYATAAFAVDKIVDFTKQTIELGAQLDGVARSFESIEMSGSVSLEQLKEATKGTVSELELMRQAVQARNFKIPMEGLADLFEFATIRAQQTGESVEYLTRSIVLGIGRKSPLILDNLGITLVRLKEAMGKVGRESATVREIFDGTVKIAKEETAIIKMLGDDSLTAANKISRLTTSFKDLQMTFGDEIVKSTWWEQILDGGEEFMKTNKLRRSINTLLEDALISEGIDWDEMFKQGIITTDATKMDLSELQILSKEIIATKKRLQEEYGEKAVSILGEDALEESAKDIEAFKAHVETLMNYSKMSDRENRIMAKGFVQAVKEKEKAMSEEIAAEMARQEKLTSIRDGLASSLDKAQENFRQNHDEQKYLSEAISAYSSTLHELRKNGFMATETFSQFDTVLSALKSKFYQLQAEDDYADVIWKIEQETISLTIAQKALKDSIEEVRKSYKEMLLARELAEIEAHLDENGGDWEGSNDEDPNKTTNDNLDEQIKKLQKIATMWGVISQAIGGIANNISGDGGLSKGIKLFARLAQTAAATAAAVAAVKSAFDPAAGGKMVATAVGVATALGGILGAVGGISTGSASGGGFASSYNGGEVRTYTELRGRDIRIAESRDRSFSDRRG